MISQRNREYHTPVNIDIYRTVHIYILIQSIYCYLYAHIYTHIYRSIATTEDPVWLVYCITWPLYKHLSMYQLQPLNLCGFQQSSILYFTRVCFFVLISISLFSWLLEEEKIFRKVFFQLYFLFLTKRKKPYGKYRNCN